MPRASARLNSWKTSGVCQPAAGQFLNRIFEPHQVDDPAHQRRFRELGDPACELVALTFELLIPIRRLQAAQAIGQHDLRKQAPHGAAHQRAINAFGSAEWRHSPTVSHDPSGARAERAFAQHREILQRANAWQRLPCMIGFSSPRGFS
jgi:hypothetical protein